MHVGIKAQRFLLNLDRVFHQWLTKIAGYSSARRLLEMKGGNCSLHHGRGAARAPADRPSELGPRQSCKGHRHACKELLKTSHGKKRRKPRTAPITQNNQGRGLRPQKSFLLFWTTHEGFLRSSVIGNSSIQDAQDIFVLLSPRVKSRHSIRPLSGILWLPVKVLRASKITKENQGVKQREWDFLPP